MIVLSKAAEGSPGEPGTARGPLAKVRPSTSSIPTSTPPSATSTRAGQRRGDGGGVHPGAGGRAGSSRLITSSSTVIISSSFPFAWADHHHAYFNGRPRALVSPPRSEGRGIGQGPCGLGGL